MKIKRWAIYDGVAKQYYPKRFIFRANAVRAREDLIFGYGLDLIPIDDVLTVEEIDSIQVVELT
jgi:hypothetical protein